MEIVRRVVRTDDARPFLNLLHEDIQVDTRAYPLPDWAGVFAGRKAAERFFTRFWATWDDYSIDVEEVIDAGADNVVVCLREQMKGKGGGVPLESTVAQLWTFADGKLYRWRAFRTKAEALEAAGLSE